jgi:hypothetical protein
MPTSIRDNPKNSWDFPYTILHIGKISGRRKNVEETGGKDKGGFPIGY